MPLKTCSTDTLLDIMVTSWSRSGSRKQANCNGSIAMTGEPSNHKHLKVHDLWKGYMRRQSETELGLGETHWHEEQKMKRGARHQYIHSIPEELELPE